MEAVQTPLKKSAFQNAEWMQTFEKEFFNDFQRIFTFSTHS